MFYVSDIKTRGKFKLVGATDIKDGVKDYHLKTKDEYKLIGVTDTKDGVTEYYREDALLNLLNNRKFYCEIYGVLPYADELWLSALTLNKDITANELKHRILNWRHVFSTESKLLVQYYLLEAKIGTAITIAIDKIEDNGQRLKYEIRYVKIDEDSWESSNGYFDTSKGLSGFLLEEGVIALGIGDDDHFDKVVFNEVVAVDGFEKRVNSSKNRNTRIVRVQKSRVCSKCGAVISAVSKCLTTNAKGTGRRWVCMNCLDKELKGHTGVNFNCNVYKELGSVCMRLKLVNHGDEGGYLALMDYYDELVSECVNCGKCGLSRWLLDKQLSFFGV